jgi:SOS-response transcriptional repressor LexA
MKEIENVPDVNQGDRWESPDHKLGARGWAHIVEGDSMDDGTDRGVPDGWLIFVDPDVPPQAGHFVIAKDVATQSATFKKLTYDGGRWYLTPLNRQYPAMEIDSPDLRVIAVVTEARPPSRKLL